MKSIIVSWQDPQYHRIRRNFNGKYGYNDEARTQFENEVDHYGGKVRFIFSADSDRPQVTDGLQMNEYREIVFDDEEQFLMFLLKWG